MDARKKPPTALKLCEAQERHSIQMNTLKYEQGPLSKILDPHIPKVSEMIFPGGGPGDQRIVFRAVAACFVMVLESNLRNQAYDPRTPHFMEPFCCQKKASKIASKQNPQSHRLNCPPVSFAPMLIPSSYFILFLNPPINTNRSRLSFSGNFRFVSLIFN